MAVLTRAEIGRLIKSVEDLLTEKSRTCIPSVGPIHISCRAADSIVAIVDHELNAQESDEYWCYFRIPTTKSKVTNLIMHRLKPFINELKNSYNITGWWWLIKADPVGYAVRLRIGTLQKDRLALIDKVLQSDLGTEYTIDELSYEPEMNLFGGTRGIALAHTIFSLDSDFITNWTKEVNRRRPPFIPPAISVTAIRRLLNAAGLDVFEQWDVMQKVCDKRPQTNAVRDVQTRIDQWMNNVVRLDGRISRVVDSSAINVAEDYLSNLEVQGRTLAIEYFSGHLNCGLREFLAPIVLFHWNRICLPFVLQSAICHAMAAYLKLSSRASGAGR